MEWVRFCDVFQPNDGSFVAKFCPFILSPHNQTQIITSLAGALIFVVMRPVKKPAIIVGVVNCIVQRLPMEGALSMIGDLAGTIRHKVTSELHFPRVGIGHTWNFNTI